MVYNNALHTNLFTDNAVVLGIIRDNPALVPPKECRYDTALVLSAQQEINDECVQHDILQGGSYAIFTIHHTAEALNEAWEAVFNELAETGHQLDATRPILERYMQFMLENHLCEICLPIQV